jgi:hypothetical protein
MMDWVKRARKETEMKRLSSRRLRGKERKNAAGSLSNKKETVEIVKEPLCAPEQGELFVEE